MKPNISIEPAAPARVIFLSALLERGVFDATGHQLGRLADIIVRHQDRDYPRVSALVLRVGASTIFVPIADVSDIGDRTGGERIELTTARLDMRPFERRDGEMLLRKDLLGHRLVDVERVEFVRAHDVRLTLTDDGWVATGLDVRKPYWWGGPIDRASSVSPDWRSFKALVGLEPSLLVRPRSGQLHQLKAADIADLIETATLTEGDQLLTHVHDDPELEDERQALLRKILSATEAVNVSARVRAKADVDTIAAMPQERHGAAL
jgi:sporulation protein YlmC with PRC-barrel domain